MVQALWYVRASGRVSGPFPAPQVDEALRSGEIAITDELSLDGEQWLPVRESGFFHGKSHVDVTSREDIDPAWRAERDRARQRWADDSKPADSVDSPTPALDAVRMQSLREDHDATRALLDAEMNRRPKMLIALAAILILILAGGLVWFGQSGETTIKASLGKAADCAAAPASGGSWSGCDKIRLSLAGANLGNMSLSRARFDGSVLAGANLGYSDLSKASLRGANLSGANLMGANLEGADLTGADLTGADLRYATLSKALIEGVRIDGAIMGKTTWVDGNRCDSPDQCR